MKTTLLTLFSLAAWGQNASIPIAGYLMDGAAVRPIVGVPGASHQSAPLTLPDDLRILRLGPASAVALGVSAGSGAALLYDLESGSRTMLDRARPNSTGGVFSPLGTALALSFDDGWTQIFARSGDQWNLTTEFSTSATAIAVSDDGGSALLAEPGGLTLRNASGVAVVAPAAKAFAFLAGSNTPAYVTGSRLQAGEVSFDLGEDSLSYLLASPRASTLLLARADGRVATFDDHLQQLFTASCDCPVSGLDSAGRPGTVRLLADTGGILWLADAAAGNPLYFVPALRDASAQ